MSRGVYQVHQMLLCFQCQRVPLDVVRRACEPKLVWSATGEIEQIQPYEGGVPQWLIDFWRRHKPLLSHGDCIDGLQLVSDCGISYFDIHPTDSLQADEEEQDLETFASQCMRIFNHAFPCRNTEVLGEEITARFMPLAKAFLLPLLASVSEKDIQDWLLPQERKIQFAISLFDCLLQIFTSLGPHSPLYPTNFPRKLINAINTPTTQGRGVEPCLTVFLELIQTISSSSLKAFERLAFNAACSGLDERSNAWTGLALGVLLRSQTAKRPLPRTLSDAITKAATSWNPKSTTRPSPMEYLIAIELLPHARLRTISLPEPLDIELSILQGLLLSRMEYHREAATVLHATFSAATSRWGSTSFQVGIIAAECANCYNMLRREDSANKIATRFLAERETPELTSRQDWFYLNLSLVDSFIGRGRYAEAAPIIQQIISQPSVPPMIHMMGCLRLSKICRRVPEMNEAVEPNHSLQEGLGLFNQVSSALQEEYLEEVCCSLSSTRTTHGSLEAQEVLMGSVNDLLSQTDLEENPAQKRYAQAQIEFKQHTLRPKNETIVPRLKFCGLPSLPLINDGATSHKNTGSSSDINNTTTPMATRRAFFIPHERSDHFVPRPEVARMMDLPIRDPRIELFTVRGEVGIGKTSFVTDFAHQVSGSYSTVIWIRDAPLDEMFDNFLNVALQLKLRDVESSRPIPQDQALKQLFKWFQRPRRIGPEEPWLIVFDGIESEQVLRQLWPTAGRYGTVVVITREIPSFIADWDIDWHTDIQLEPLDLPEAVLLASIHMPTSGHSPAVSQPHRTDDLHSLVALLDFHPAAIEKAASRISGGSLGVRGFIDEYKAIQSSYLTSRAINEIFLQSNHNLALITLWLMESQDRDFFFLSVVCMLLADVEIDEDLLWPGGPFIAQDNYPQSAPEFAATRDRLLESSLIWRYHGRHGLFTSMTVQVIFRDRMDPPWFQDALCRALLLLSQSWPCKFEDFLLISYTLPTHSECSKLWPHVSSLYGELHQLHPPDIPFSKIIHIVEALLNTSWCAIIRRANNYATLFLDLANRLLEPRVPASDMVYPILPEMIRQRCLLNHHQGRLAYRHKRYEEARACFERCLALVINQLGPGSESYWYIQAAAYHGLGDVSRKTKSIETSITSYEMGINALKHIGEKSQQHVSTLQVNLGLSLLLNEHPKAAENVLEQARQLKSAASIGDETSSSLRDLVLSYELAVAKLAQNKAEESLQLALEYPNKALLSFVPEDSLGGVFHLILSSAYGRLSNFSLARNHLRQAISAFSVVLIPPHLKKQERLYALMSQGTQEPNELEAGSNSGHTVNDFLSMHLFAASIISHIF